MRHFFLVVFLVCLTACSTAPGGRRPPAMSAAELATLPFESATAVNAAFRSGTAVVQYADNGAVRKWTNGNGTFHASTTAPNFEGGEGFFSVNGPGTWSVRDNTICVSIKWQVKQAEVGREEWCQGLVRANDIFYLVPLNRNVPRSGKFNPIELTNSRS